MNSTLPPIDESARAVVRHLVATLAYRAAKVMRGVPVEFATRTFTDASRRPVDIVAHLGDLMAWAITLVHGESVWKAEGRDDWSLEMRRFFDGLAALDRELEANVSLRPDSIEKLIQGPLADALTHVGQLALLRGMAGVPVRPESYARAEIVIGRVGMEQAPAGKEFDGDASRRK
jgi:hypothetical protein